MGIGHWTGVQYSWCICDFPPSKTKCLIIYFTKGILSLIAPVQWNNISVPLFKETGRRQRPEAALSVRREGFGMQWVLLGTILTAHTCTGSGMQENRCSSYSTLFPLNPFVYSSHSPNLPSITWTLHCYHILIILALPEIFSSFQAGHFTWKMGAAAAVGKEPCPLLPPCCSHRRAAAPQQWPAWLPTACSTGKITGRAVFFKGKLQYGWGGWFWLQALYFTAPWRVDVA